MAVRTLSKAVAMISIVHLCRISQLRPSRCMKDNSKKHKGTDGPIGGLVLEGVEVG